MPSARKCVFGCEENSPLFTLPKDETIRQQWLEFIFGSGPCPKKICYVCSRHFSDDCFQNKSLFESGLISTLTLKHYAIPILKRTTSSEPAARANAAIHLHKSRNVACQTDPLLTRTAGTQLSFRTLQPPCRSKAVQATCNEISDPISTADPFSSTLFKRPLKRPRLEFEDELEDASFEGTSLLTASKGQDSTHDPADSVTQLTDSSVLSQKSSTPPHKMKKYIVYESCIMELFASCPVCTWKCDVRTKTLGTFLSVYQRCPHCEFSKHWQSQPILGSTPAGNIHLSAAVYLSGASFMKTERVFRAMELQLFKRDTFYRHARSFIEPAVIHHWKTSQNMMLQQLKQDNKLIVGGDMRADSPGHSPKYGTYTTMDLNRNTILDIQLVQSNEVDCSYHMKKEGLVRSLALLEGSGISPDCIVTDRHPEIQKFLSESIITHYYDACHIAKGISKRIDIISKQKDCQKLKKWKKSINNHLYWTAATSTTGPERVAKWTSILNHIQDIHTHEDPLYPTCLHEVQPVRDKNKWLQAETPAFCKLEKVLTNKRILKDVEKLSPHHQTLFVEAFHSVTHCFAPKNVVFPFIGMLCRLCLAAIHYNENANRPQALTQGEPVKALKGECKAKPQKTEQTFRYVEDLLDLIFNEVCVDPAPYTEALLAIPVPEDLSAQYERPDEEEHFVNGNLTSEYPNPLHAVQVLNQTKEKLRGCRNQHKKRCISSVQNASSTDDAEETEQHVINSGGGAALFEARAKLTMSLKSSTVEKKLCHASCQADPVQIFPNDARVILLGKDFPPLFVKAADLQGTTHYRNYHSSDQSTQPTPTLIQDTCITTAFSQGIKSKPPTFGQESRSEPPTFGQEIRSEPPTFGQEIRSEPPTFGQEIRSEPPTFGQEIRSEPPTFGQEIRSEPPTFGQEIRSEPPPFGPEMRSEPPPFGPEMRSEPPTFGPEIKSESPTFDLEIKSEPPTFGLNIKSEPPTFGLEIKSEPPTFGIEIKSEPPTFGIEIKSEPLTYAQEIKSEPPTFGQEIRSEPPPFGQETRSQVPTFGQEIRSEPPPFGQETRSQVPTFGQEIRSEPSTVGPEIRFEPPTFGQGIRSQVQTVGPEIRSEPPTFGLEIKWQPLTHTILYPILQLSTASPLVETAAHNHELG
ncbi:uncharacterized protein LOC114454733 isoform X3 [Gouania willdenowi]|uniref:uncharacterized protein LOC114454733 isoform X3 n=1 Tax=Gouania willdenowi TaxID=441366 RepID=UPI001056B17F|nr:uncharacterized protein LOC114454733 isoform X3 [Gouania willdenowi]